MNNKILFIFICLFCITSQAQVISFADINFKNALLNATIENVTALSSTGESIVIDSNGNGQIEVSEAHQVYALAVVYANITNLNGIANFTNLRRLICSNNSLAYLNLSALTHLEDLYCDYNSIAIINFGAITTLKTLYCNDNQLSSLNLNQFHSLTDIDCKNNSLNSITVNQCTALTTLECSNNNLTAINVSGLVNLLNLSCNQNSLQNLSFTGLQNLTGITCAENLLTAINVGNLPNLGYLDCSHNNITGIALSNMAALEQLTCNNNALTSLSFSNCPMMFNIDCSYNQLSSLNLSSLFNLRWFWANNNQLTNLNASGLNNLFRFECANNLLTEFDLNGNFSNAQFVLNNNTLQTILAKNNALQYFEFMGNPNFHYICCDEFEKDQFLNAISNYGYANCIVNSYCTIESSGFSYKMDAAYKYDGNSNGCDGSDSILTNVKTKLYRSSVINPETSFNGQFTDIVESDYNMVPVLENPGYFTVSPPNIAFNVPSVPNPYTGNFCIAPNGTHADIETVILPLSVESPGLDSSYKVFIRNKGTLNQSGLLTFTFNDAVLNFTGATPAVSSQSTNVLSWNYSNLKPFETKEFTLAFHLNSTSDTPALALGDLLSFSASATGVSTDETPNDNSFTYNIRAAAPAPDNYKACTEGVAISPTAIGDYVHYIIRFRNNGAATVQNLIITDAIDTSKLDLSSIVMLGSSHAFTSNISNSGDSTLKFIFKDINLIPSEGGYVAFKIKTSPTLTSGSIFTNTAKIVFKYDENPVNTNTASTYVGSPLGNNDIDLEKPIYFYPNPAKDKVTFTQTVRLVSVYALDGKLMAAQLENKSIDISHLSKGVYIVRIIDENGMAHVEKLSKE